MMAMIDPKRNSCALRTDYEMNRRRGQILAILSLVATAGLLVLFILMRSGAFTFIDDFTGLKAVGLALTWALMLLATSILLGGLAWRADRRSWLAWWRFFLPQEGVGSDASGGTP